MELPWNHGDSPTEFSNTTFSEGPYKGYKIDELEHYFISDPLYDVAKFYKNNLDASWKLVDSSTRKNNYGITENDFVWKRGNQVIFIAFFSESGSNGYTILEVGLFEKPWYIF